jgi:regulator of protease activity HflC (stomatin/prohibitin superfamily)
MNLRVIEERELVPVNGLYVLLLLVATEVLVTVAFVLGCMDVEGPFGVALIVGSTLASGAVGVLFGGLKVVRPNEARVMLLFGSYHGTIKRAGYHYVNPFCSSFNPDLGAARASARSKASSPVAAEEGAGTATPTHKTVSLKTQTLDNGLQKVNDVLGNPIIIGAIVIWRVADPTQAVFSVESYRGYLSTQTDSTIRNIARLYPYDVFSEEDKDDDVHEKTLRGSALEIAQSMQAELQKRVSDAGLEIDEVRITHLAYSEEIAAAMLQRQQAVAIIAARQKIVDGAVGMVKMAIDKLSEDGVVVLDEERKAQMVSNLLVVLCGNHDAQPIVNTGSIY